MSKLQLRKILKSLKCRKLTTEEIKIIKISILTSFCTKWGQMLNVKWPRKITFYWYEGLQFFTYSKPCFETVPKRFKYVQSRLITCSEELNNQVICSSWTEPEGKSISSKLPGKKKIIITTAFTYNPYHFISNQEIILESAIMCSYFFHSESWTVYAHLHF